MASLSYAPRLVLGITAGHVDAEEFGALITKDAPGAQRSGRRVRPACLAMCTWCSVILRTSDWLVSM